jgi:hypothetical protein
VSGTCLKDLVVGLAVITVTVSAFYWVLTYGPRQVTTTVTVTAPLIDGGGLGRALDVCFSWSRRCDEIAVRLIDSASRERKRGMRTLWSFREMW